MAEEPAPSAAPHPDLRGVSYLQLQLHLNLPKVQALLASDAAAATKEDVLDELLAALSQLPPPQAPPQARPEPQAATGTPAPTPAAAAPSGT